MLSKVRALCTCISVLVVRASVLGRGTGLASCVMGMWVLGVNMQARVLVRFARRCLEWVLLLLRMNEAGV